jgi:hypothetical protein
VSGEGAVISRRRTGEGSLASSSRSERANSNGKRQNSNGLQFADFSNPKPFAI